MLRSFLCYYPREFEPIILLVREDPTEYIEGLLTQIEARIKQRLGPEFYANLLLFKATNIPVEPQDTLLSRVLEWVHEQPRNSQLKTLTCLETIFPDGPHAPKERMLDIIIADAEVLEMADNLDDPYYLYKRTVKKGAQPLTKCVTHISSLPTPSTVVNDPHTLAEVFGGKEPLIHMGRPGGVPAVIFNTFLAALQQDLDNIKKVEVSERKVSLAAIYILRAVRFHEGEETRQDEIKGLIDDAITGPVGRASPVDIGPLVDSIKPTCAWWPDRFPVLLLEVKNSSGLSGDALYQAIVDYSKIVSQDMYQSFREYCHFPCVLVNATANRIEISVAVCVGPIYVTKLLTLDLSLGFHGSENIIRLARVFKSLSHHRVEIAKYYQSVKSSPSPALSCLFPNLTPIDPSKPLPKLTYRQIFSGAGQPTSNIVDLGNASTAMYIATLDDTNKEVIVKFTALYNEEAHRLLTQAQLAPQLHYCGRVVGDLYMIVMERVDGASVWQLHENNIPIHEIVPTKVEEAVHLLHEQDIVFGDLRSNNILYVASGARDVVLVDFDWPGKHGEARYPATLNVETRFMMWHADVSPYGIMRKAHDLWQLNQLKALCDSALGRVVD